VAVRYGRRFEFDGDELALWCYSEEGLAPDASPRIGLRDAAGGAVVDIPLLSGDQRLPARKWAPIRLPLTRFAGLYGGTDETKFDLSKLHSVELVQGLDDGQRHTLFVDDIRVVPSGAAEGEPPRAPTGLVVEGQDSHFDLAWPAGGDADVLAYRVYRSWDGSRYEPVATRPASSQRCVDFVGGPNKTAYYKLSAVDLHGNESLLSEAAQATTRALDDEELLEMVQRACFRYYWGWRFCRATRISWPWGRRGSASWRWWSPSSGSSSAARKAHGGCSRSSSFSNGPTGFTACGPTSSTAARARPSPTSDLTTMAATWSRRRS
jgi:hypothetical protein